MKYDSAKIHKLFTIQEVRILIAEQYDQKRNGSSITRKLYIHRSDCAHGVAGVLFFSLSGTPPKGFGIYQPDHKYLLIIDCEGKATRHNNCVLVDDAGKYIDISSFKDVTVLEKEDWKVK